jgi:hypothetical protein
MGVSTLSGIGLQEVYDYTLKTDNQKWEVTLNWVIRRMGSRKGDPIDVDYLTSKGRRNDEPILFLDKLVQTTSGCNIVANLADHASGNSRVTFLKCN